GRGSFYAGCCPVCKRLPFGAARRKRMDLPPPARTQIPSCFASELSFRLPCSSLTWQAQKEFGAPCRVERGGNSWPLSLSHSPASDFYSTWLIRCRAGPHTYFF